MPTASFKDPVTMNDMTVVRSDDWVALGQRRHDLPGAKTRETFVTVATESLLSGRRSVAELTLPITFNDVDGTPIEARIAAVGCRCAARARTVRASTAPLHACQSG
jgi:hypothetical protein